MKGLHPEGKAAIGPPAWLAIPWGLLPVTFFLWRAWMANNLIDRIPMLLGACLVAAIAGFGIFSRVVIADRQLKVPYNIFLRRTVGLDRLTSVVVGRKEGAGNSWFISLCDQDGRMVKFRLDSSRPVDRQRFLSALSPFVQSSSVEKSGPVEEVFTRKSWPPSGHPR